MGMTHPRSSLANPENKQIYSQKTLKMNNDIRVLTKPSQIRLVNLDMDSPRLKKAMEMLGYEKKDLDTRKRRDNFRESIDAKAPISPRATTTVEHVVK